MRQSQLGSSASRRGNYPSQTMAQQDASMAASARRRTRGEESWIEVSSQPSSSALNSTASIAPSRPTDERIPRPLIPMRSVTEPPRSTSVAGSSQDEYDESSSESDRVLSSSNEDITKEEDEVDDDDNRTAVGPRTNEVFTPQPNAFSHPPSSQSNRESYFPRVTSAPSSHIRSRPHLQRAREQAMSSSHQPDHDAALRASLTTLLSCAAAVRPKPTSGEKLQDQPQQRPSLNRPSNRPTTLRLIPESALPSQSKPATTTTSSKSPSSPTQRTTTGRRRSRSRSKDRDAGPQSKKHRPISAPCSSYDDYFISPTVAGWVISAGMVLVLSAISFSAGFAWGRDVGRAEAELGLSAAGAGNASCAHEAMRGGGGAGGGLRKIGWGSASAVRA